MRFEGKVAWVTGGASGIGRAAALRFAEEGARVAVSDVNREGTEETAAAIAGAGGEAIALVSDVTSLVDCDTAVAATVEAFGRLDAVFANAGVATGGTVEHMAEDEWLRVVDVDLNGVFRTAKAAIPALRESGGGAIVVTSSVEGLAGSAILPHYCAAKTGLIGLARAMCQELAPQGIRVNCVNPGYVVTPMTEPLRLMPGVLDVLVGKIPLGRAAEPEDVAGVVVSLCSDDFRYVTGQWLAVDGGLTAVI